MRNIVVSYDFYPLLLIDPEDKEPKKGLWPFVLPKLSHDAACIRHIENAYLAARISVPYSPAAEYVSETDHRKVNALLLCLSQLAPHDQAMLPVHYGRLKSDYLNSQYQPGRAVEKQEQGTLFRGMGQRHGTVWSDIPKPRKPPQEDFIGWAP